MKKVLVLGGSSFIGLHFLEDAKEKYDLWATYHRNKIDVENCTILKLDIINKERTATLLKAITPDVVILCSAISAVVSKEKGEAEMEAVNVSGVQNIVDACREVKAKLIFISTDCVFSGEAGPYKELDVVSPVQVYGRTKVDGEKIVAQLPNYAIIRTSLVYGWPKQFQHGNFVTTLIQKMNSQENFTAYTNRYRTPTFVGDVSATINKLIEKDETGTFHIGSKEYIQIYQFAEKVCEVFGLNTRTLQTGVSPSEEEIKRPARAGLISQDTEERLGIKFKSVQDGLLKMKESSPLDITTKQMALVTGGCGFIGSHLVEKLVEKGLKVRILDNLVKGKLETVQYLVDKGDVEFIEGNISNRDIVDDVMKNVDYVFHTAGIHIKRSDRSPDDCITSNIQGSYNIFASALQHNIKRVIFSSSSSIYGDPLKLPMNEKDFPNVIEPYGASKLFCEHLLQHLAKKGLKYNALRYFNVYGERQAEHAYYTTVVTHFVKRIMNNEPPTIDGKGDQSMDFTHVSDVVDANILAMKSKAFNEVFNVGTGVDTSIAQLAQIIIKALDKDLQPIFREREVLVNKRKADTTKAESLLGFRAKVSVEEGLTRVVQKIAANPEKY